MAALSDAISRYQSLIEEGNKSPTTLDGLGNAHIELGLARRSLGDHKGARESWRRAIEAHEAELKFTSNDPEVRTNLASSLSNIALSHDDVGRTRCGRGRLSQGSPGPHRTRARVSEGLALRGERGLGTFRPRLRPARRGPTDRRARRR